MNDSIGNNNTPCEGCGSTDIRTPQTSGITLCITCVKEFEDFLDNLFISDT